MGSIDIFTFTLAVAGALTLCLLFIGIILSLSERSHRRKRAQQLKLLWEEPSGIRWPTRSQIPATSPSVGESFAAPPAPEVPVAPEVPSVPEVSAPPEAFAPPVAAPEPDPPAAPVVEALPPTPAVEEPPAAPPSAAPVQISPGNDKRAATIAFGALQFDAQGSVVTPDPVTPPAPVKEATPADHVLYLDPDFELSEIKRILRIWSLLPVDNSSSNVLGSWECDDGTTVELVPPGEEGFPALELRGPMSEDLAQFLPEDLPVHPLLPTELV